MDGWHQCKITRSHPECTKNIHLTSSTEAFQCEIWKKSVITLGLYNYSAPHRTLQMFSGFVLPMIFMVSIIMYVVELLRFGFMLFMTWMEFELGRWFWETPINTNNMHKLTVHRVRCDSGHWEEMVILVIGLNLLTGKRGISDRRLFISPLSKEKRWLVGVLGQLPRQRLGDLDRFQ